MVLAGQQHAVLGHLFGAEQLRAQGGFIGKFAGRNRPQTQSRHQSRNAQGCKKPFHVHRYVGYRVAEPLGRGKRPESIPGPVSRTARTVKTVRETCGFCCEPGTGERMCASAASRLA